jgi:hypothetical protein
MTPARSNTIETESTLALEPDVSPPPRLDPTSEDADVKPQPLSACKHDRANADTWGKEVELDGSGRVRSNSW